MESGVTSREDTKTSIPATTRPSHWKTRNGLLQKGVYDACVMYPDSCLIHPHPCLTHSHPCLTHLISTSHTLTPASHTPAHVLRLLPHLTHLIPASHTHLISASHTSSQPYTPSPLPHTHDSCCMLSLPLRLVPCVKIHWANIKI